MPDSLIPSLLNTASRLARWTLMLLVASESAWTAEPAVQPAKSLPAINQPIPFNTPEADAILAAMQIFPPDNPWNTDISSWPVRANSAAIVASVGAEKPLRYNPDMAFILVPPNQPKVEISLVGYPDESDKGPFPITDNLPIEGWPLNYRGSVLSGRPSLEDVQRDKARQGGDRHAIMVDPLNGVLYELFATRRTDRGWQAASAAIFNLNSNALRTAGWTSADAAGLPIFPAVIRYDELQRGLVAHAMRFTIRDSQRAYVHPATHFASNKTDPNLPRMGERFRLKSDFNITGFSPPMQAILKGLKKYGMLVADNGIEWALSCAPDERIPNLHEELRRVQGSSFEVVEPPAR